ncbi:MAG: sugar ABC transporter ATP-binding protein [Planctomycetota bacterium]|nr:sugar ABC transporter ATP-binding protein [Planctomycetota bacterium]
MTDITPPLLVARGITKSFPGVRALRGVDLTLAKGEVLAIVGENGAGKSTLMKVLAGVQPADSGSLEIDGRQVQLQSVTDALRLGIALIHQELNLADNLDVAANVFLGREFNYWGCIHRRELYQQAEQYLRMVGLEVQPSTIVKDLSIGQQQMVEIAKALSVDARVLIMDEPTSSLSASESRCLFDVIRQLKGRGVSVVYISHRLGEVLDLADRVTVLRDGQNAGELMGNEISRDRMVRMMVGRDVQQFYCRKKRQPGPVLLQAKELVTATWPKHPINLSVRSGEIVGLAGLVGAGRTELLRTLFGIDRQVSGEVRIDGKVAILDSPRDAIQLGVALVPEDRKQHGLVLEMSVRHNIGLAGLRRNQLRAGLVNQRQEADDTARMVQLLHIRTPSHEQATQFLSGGNQQKVVMGKWLSGAPKVLLLDEPTRGIDVGAKEEIYGLIESLAEQGMAILFVSSEMEEILGMADRVLVMHEGRMTGELPRGEMTEEAILQLATGGKH